MSQPDPTLPANPELDRLLLEIHARVRTEQYGEAAQRLERARALAPDHPAVLEAEGDLAFAQRRFSQAMQCYKRAFDLDRSNARVEEKFATALVKVNMPSYHLDAIPDDVEDPWSYHKARPPIASAILSILVPGLGQLYNGEFLKGGIVLLLGLACWSSLIHAANAVINALRAGGTTVNLTSFLPAVTRNAGTVVVLLLLLGLWIYSIVDAVLVARSLRAHRGWDV